MYKSPIEIIEINDIVNEIVDDINGKFDKAVMAEVKACVNVDKEELIKALNYDRAQYEKGYNDGKLEAVVHGHWNKIANNNWGVVDGYQCSACGEECSSPDWVIDEVDEDYVISMMHYCYNCGAKMDEAQDENG